MNNHPKLEIITGFFVIAASILFLFYGLKQGNISPSQDSYLLSASFSDISGVNIGADVKLSGVKIGTVKETSLNSHTYQADITLTVRDNVKIPSDSIIKIASDGLLGGSHIQIEAGSEEEFLLSGDRFEHTQSSVSLIDLISRAVFSGN